MSRNLALSSCLLRSSVRSGSITNGWDSVLLGTALAIVRGEGRIPRGRSLLRSRRESTNLENIWSVQNNLPNLFSANNTVSNTYDELKDTTTTTNSSRDHQRG